MNLILQKPIAGKIMTFNMVEALSLMTLEELSVIHLQQDRNLYASVPQPFYTRGTLNIVEESWRHTNPIMHIVGEGGRWFMALIGRGNFL
jgi:hypothetical protein